MLNDVSWAETSLRNPGKHPSLSNNSVNSEYGTVTERGNQRRSRQVGRRGVRPLPDDVESPIIFKFGTDDIPILCCCSVTAAEESTNALYQDSG